MRYKQLPKGFTLGGVGVEKRNLQGRVCFYKPTLLSKVKIVYVDRQLDDGRVEFRRLSGGGGILSTQVESGLSLHMQVCEDYRAVVSLALVKRRVV